MSTSENDKTRPIDVEDQFYDFLAGGTKMFLLTSMVDLKLDALLFAAGNLTGAEIIARLGLEAVRGRKWLRLLAEVGLVRTEPTATGDDTRYFPGPLTYELARPGSPASYFYREFLRYWRQAASHEMTSLVKGAPVPWPVRYPPVAWDDVVLLHEWMRSGALLTLEAIQKVFDFSTAKRLLDVGGGDATMACTLATRVPELRITVFNLPQPAYLCRQNIAAYDVAGRVDVTEGDFRRDELPRGYDLVMFSRVMADWDPATCRMLMGKARLALVPGGRILIAEPFSDENPALGLAWEHSYLPYDDFGAGVYKPRAQYHEMLAETGFAVEEDHPRGEHSIHGVIVARRKEPTA